MKKVFLSVFLIVAFSAYVVYAKGNQKANTAVLPGSKNGNLTIPTPALDDEGIPIIISDRPIRDKPKNGYRDGEYTGNVVDAFFGYIQVRAVIADGKITDVVFLKYPNDRPTSIQINEEAIPILKEEAIIAQSAKVDIVTGATQSAEAFRISLQSALDQARI